MIEVRGAQKAPIDFVDVVTVYPRSSSIKRVGNANLLGDGLALVENLLLRDLRGISSLDLDLDTLEGLLDGVLGSSVHHLGLDLGVIRSPATISIERDHEEALERKFSGSREKPKIEKIGSK